ncbi:ATP-binding protein [Nucisporomicrobium flavum]|uniref:ATP-binding protein n=1 Tax=Nucisporomicrobium flavum TaxID=2785915 RepID=UPI003C2D10AC
MTDLGEAPLTWQYGAQGGLSVLTVDGTLTRTSSELLHAAATGLLRQGSGRLLVDLSGLMVADKDAIRVFAGIAAQALLYPDVLVMVCAPTAEVMRLLSVGVLDARLVFDSMVTARAAALAESPAMTEDLLPISGAARQARNVITEACLLWDEPDLIGSAALVVSEMVTNAVVHAHTMMTMQVHLRPCHVRIAVFDGSGRPAAARAASVSGTGGRGLHLVEAVSEVWGSATLPEGKVVWAALSRTGR